jgi:hypothetical protein
LPSHSLTCYTQKRREYILHNTQQTIGQSIQVSPGEGLYRFLDTLIGSVFVHHIHGTILHADKVKPLRYTLAH